MARPQFPRVRRPAIILVTVVLVLAALSIGAARLGASSTVTLVGAGDIASCSFGSARTAALVASIPGTVFTVGDNAYDNGSVSDYTRCYDPTWGRFKDRTRPVPGNHEYQTPGAAGYFWYFGAAAGNPSSPWYAYDLGAWRIYALNANCSSIGGCGPGSAEEQWLRSDLAANPSRCILAYWHEPRFSSGEHGDDTAVQALWQDLEDFHAELVISGHDHDYERFAPQTATGAPDPNGIVEIVVGTGGKSLRTFGPPVPNSLVRDSSTFGVLKLTLGPDSWQSTFVPVAGGTFTDTASGTCH